MDVAQILNILSWIGGVCGVTLILLLLFSILLGSHFDIDLHTDIDIDADSSSMGVVKSVLAFVSVSTLTIRAISMNSKWPWLIAAVVGVVAGVITIIILSWLLRMLLQQQEDGSWELVDALGITAEVYLSIPENGSGRINVPINGVSREIEARSQHGNSIPTGTKVLVIEVLDSVLVVIPNE